MTVSRIYESPRVTLPTPTPSGTPSTPSAKKSTPRLRAGDVRLTMGGEPTFISIDDMDGPEWNTAAVGPTKRSARRPSSSASGSTTAPAASSTTARANGIRANPSPAGPSPPLAARRPAGLEKSRPPRRHREAHRSHRRRRPTLRLPPLANASASATQWLMPGYEDTWYLPLEGAPPAGINVDPLKNKLADAQERARLAKIFEQGLDHIVGYALPLERAAPSGWASGPWFLRPDHLFLIPGDSPMGLPPAARFAAVGRAGRRPPFSSSPTPRSSFRRCPAPKPSPGSTSRRRPVLQPGRGFGAHTADRLEWMALRRHPGRPAATTTRARNSGSRPVSLPAADTRRRTKAIGRGSCAPRSASSRAKATSSSSCRRCAPPRTTSTCSRHRGHLRRVRRCPW
jgi:hypothetical protein